MASNYSRFPYEIREVIRDDLPKLATLLAPMVESAIAKNPAIPATYTSPKACQELLEEEYENTDAAVAEGNGNIVGYLGGQAFSSTEGDLDTVWWPPRHIKLQIEWGAVREGEDPTRVNAVLFAHLAERWLARGYTSFLKFTPVGNAGYDESWINLNFGRAGAAMVRPSTPMAGRFNDQVSVRMATIDDLDETCRFSELEQAHHRTPPIFLFNSYEVVKKNVREERREQIEGDEFEIFIAELNGEVVGMALLDNWQQTLIKVEDSINLPQVIVDPAVRSAGIGTAILNAVHEWARNQGFDYITLAAFDSNISAMPYWEGNDWKRTGQLYERRLDPRLIPD